jgi:hypothetical protein
MLTQYIPFNRKNDATQTDVLKPNWRIEWVIFFIKLLPIIWEISR